ncbi:cell wall protein [Streptomyces sp. NPDC005012]|uniref:cell wall protein n=1 Tax=unclassified Streptomyces TaxID=2593676 RepID=UPI0033A78D35
MSTTRRSLLTAAAAGALLGALSFVPSANASVTPERPESRSADVLTAEGVPAHDVPRASGTFETSAETSGETSGLRTMTGAASDDSGPDSAPGASDGSDPAPVTVPARTGDVELADTGAFDTTPYVLGGTAFLGIGAGFVAYSVRRERLGL